MMLRGNKGSVLIVALWVLFVLAALTVAAAGHVWTVLQAAERLQSRATARMDAKSSAAWVAAVLREQLHNADENESWDGVSVDAWNRDASLFVLPREWQRHRGDAGTVSFAMPGEDRRYAGVIGEEGRLHLNRDDPDLLRNLFVYFGGETGLQVANAIFRVIPTQDDNDSSGSDAERYDRTFFQTVEDLRMVDGIDAAFYAKLSPHLTVYGKGKAVNVNSATHAVLVAYFMGSDDPGIVENAAVFADQIITARAEQGFVGREDFKERISGVTPGTWELGPMGVGSTAFRGKAIGVDDAGNVAMKIEFVWDTTIDQFVLWRERVP